MSHLRYQSLGESAALEKQQQRSRRSKYVVIGSIIGLLILIGVGAGVGFALSKNSRVRSSGGTGSSPSGSRTQISGSTSSSSDPSLFSTDSRLHKSFYGIAYTPEGSLPDYGCSSTLESVITDMQLLSQLTNRIRLYGGDCNQTALVLEAIKQTKIDMQVFVGNFVVDGDATAYERQRDAIKDAITTYGANNIAGVTVGNEFMLNYLTAHHSQDPNGNIGNQGAALLIANITDTRQMLKGLNLDKTIPVGNSDAGSYFNNEVLAAVDYGMSNVHAWFANTTVQDAASWVTTFFQDTNVKPASLLTNKPQMYIAETGWPSASSDISNANNGASDASVANLQIFLDTFVCQANQAGIGYFYFEYFDEEWKDKKYGGVEGHWGLFNKDRTLKNITIPDCILVMKGSNS